MLLIKPLCCYLISMLTMQLSMMLTKTLCCYLIGMLLTELQYGQTEVSETMELLKELPVDVYHELMQVWVKALLN